MLPNRMGGGFECPAHPLGQQNGAVLPGVWEQTRELLASDAAEKIIRSQVRSRQPTEYGKHFVAGMMPVPVVDALEAIEIRQDERRRLARKPSSHQQAFAPFEEAATVRSAGQWISHGGAPIASGNPILGEAAEEISRADTDKRAFEDRKG
jgi:hypothetical protein